MNLKKLISGVIALALCISLAALHRRRVRQPAGILRAGGGSHRHPGSPGPGGHPGDLRHRPAGCRPEGPHHHGPVQPDQRHQGHRRVRVHHVRCRRRDRPAAGQGGSGCSRRSRQPGQPPSTSAPKVRWRSPASTRWVCSTSWSRGDTVQSVADLKGQTILTTGKGTTPRVCVALCPDPERSGPGHRCDH